tara:strand:- start:21 stop:689 length:669 start_codon:yes stop_codon:yes gene_type:complete
MSEIINRSNFFNKFKKTIQSNYTYLFYVLIFLVAVFSLYQFYIYSENNKILRISSKYNEAKSLQSGNEFDQLLLDITKEKNFYGLLAALEISKKLVIKNTEAAYQSYLEILKKRKLSNIYKSAIAIKASYELLNAIDNQKDSYLKVEKNINNLLTYVDPELNFYFGYKLEILYLLSISNQDYQQTSLSDVSIDLFNQIQENADISAYLKERVKSIHEFQKYK